MDKARGEWERLRAVVSEWHPARKVALVLALGMFSVLAFAFALVDLSISLWDIVKWVIPGAAHREA